MEFYTIYLVIFYITLLSFTPTEPQKTVQKVTKRCYNLIRFNEIDK